jgi:hypothetical protein
MISSSDMMIINSGLFFLTAHLAITPLGCVSVMLLLQVPKRKEREEKKEDF